MKDLVTQVDITGRNLFGLTSKQSRFKSAPDVWSVSENVEHLVWTEMGGINGIWKSLKGIKENNPIWQGQAVHHGFAIEAIIVKRPGEQRNKLPRAPNCAGAAR